MYVPSPTGSRHMLPQLLHFRQTDPLRLSCQHCPYSETSVKLPTYPRYRASTSLVRVFPFAPLEGFLLYFPSEVSHQHRSDGFAQFESADAIILEAFPDVHQDFATASTISSPMIPGEVPEFGLTDDSKSHP